MLFRLAAVACTLLVLVLWPLGGALCGPTTAEQAKAVVQGWLQANPSPLRTPLGRQVRSVDTFKNAQGEAVYFVVYLAPSGFVVVPADDLVEPVIAFAPRGRYDPSPKNPLGALVSRDLPARVGHAQAAQAFVPGLPLALQPPHLSAKAKWDRFRSGVRPRGGDALATGIGSVSDVRVAPLIASRWSQTTCPSGACYNYYTPSNDPCGCVATAMAQLMRFWQYPTSGVGTGSFTIYVNGSPKQANLRGGDGSGGAYDWANMVLVPDGSTSLTQRQAIGALCYDAGVAAHMQYTSSESGAYMSDARTALASTFGYSNVIGREGANNIGSGLTGMLNPNLDAGYPALLGISGTAGGHAIVADGYGYNSSTLYHHLNLGWAGAADAWYALPYIDTGYYLFTVVDACIYNVYVTGSGEIISGRVTDPNGTPLSGVAITGIRGAGGTYTATTNTQGIYALAKIPSASSYTLSAAKAGYSFTTLVVSTGKSKDTSSTSGNVWGANFVGTPPRALTVTAPNGGDGIEGGSTAAITWSAQGSTWQTSDQVRIEFSAGGGTTWTAITGAQNLAYNAASFAWDTTGLAAGTQYRVKVTYLSDTSINDASDANFAIVGALDHLDVAIASPQHSGAVVVGVCTVTAKDSSGRTITTIDTVNTAGRFPVALTAPSVTIAGLSGGGSQLTAANFVSGVANLASLGMTATVATVPTTSTFTATSANGKTGVSGNVAFGPDYFTQIFDTQAFDLSNHSLTFVPNGTSGYYAGYCNTISALPTDPTGGTALTFSSYDDSYASVTLSGAQVSLFGTAYTTFYVGTNGYITFGSGDNQNLPAAANHFNLPRISALLDDLFPTAGQVTWRQLADRVAVTFQGVTEYGATNSNTFQIEMYFNGRIVISYLSIAATNALAGLSRGTGVPSDYLESDLSTYPPYAANDPPVAVDDAATVAEDSTANVIDVLANDSDPNGDALTLVSVTAPAHGTAVIASGKINYSPVALYSGSDSFQYTIRDTAGATASATVRVTVTFVNHAPTVVKAIPDVAVDENSSDTIIDLSQYFGDVDIATHGDVLTYTAAILPPAGVSTVVSKVSQSSYTNYLSNDLYTHAGSDRGINGPQHGPAAANILNDFQSLGLTASLNPFTWGSTACNNVVGILPGTTRPKDVYIVGAHYDSVGNPGADDNASGVAGVLEAARVLSQFDFGCTIEFVAFDAEEAGLVGSNVFATAAKARGDNILGMLSLDMIAYNVKGVGNPGAADIYGRTDPIKQALANAVAAYGNGITTTLNGAFDASDQAPFEWQGYPAALLIEEWGNPYYHTAQDNIDTPNYIDYGFATNMTRSAVGFLATAGTLSDNASLLTATVNGNNLVLHYTTGQVGTATLTVRATDQAGAYVEDTFTVTVTPVNHPPTAVADTATVNLNSTSNLIRVLTNDSDPDGDSLTIAAVTVPSHGTAAIQGTQVNYTPTIGYTGTDSFQYTISDGRGGTASATVTVTVVLAASAIFVTTDTTTQGNWQGTYGLQGYNVINDTVSYPAYATVSASGQWAYTWTTSTADARALQKVGGGRIAACWGTSTSITIDLNLTDGQMHRVALYFLDWDTTERAESVKFLDAATSAVLDTRAATSFHGGSYLVWDVTGHVKIQVTLTAGANAVLSGLFFSTSVPDTTAPTAPTGLTATAAGTSVSLSWTAASDAESGIGSYKVYRGTAAGGETLLTSVAKVTSYTDTTAARNTTYYYKVSAVNGVNLEGPQSNEASTTTTQPQGASAVFVKADTATQGDWQGTYGLQGYNVINDTVSYPAYATVSASGQGPYTWAASSTEARALARVGGGRIAACWVAPASMTIDLNLTDGQTHRVALYFLDWDGTDRAETVAFLDAGTSAVLDTRTATSFHGGSYLVWDVTGHVKIQVTRTEGANVVLSGLFFSTGVPDTTPPTAPTGLAATAAGTSVSLSWTAASDAESGISSYKVYRGTAAGGETLLASAGNVTSYTDTTAVGNTTYYYKASAVNGVNLEGPQSNEASATTTQPQGASAVFVKTDTTTQGDWQGTYGLQGYNVINDTVSYPAYATVSASGQGAYTWAASSTEARALARVAGGRIAACWVASASMTIDLNLTDGQTHRVALYFLDWDGTDRVETVAFLDAGTSAVLDTRTATSFHGGSYLVWDVTGHVKIQVTRTGGANVVLSGLFFSTGTPDTTPPTVPTGLAATAAGTSVSLSWTAASDPESGINAYKVYRGTAAGGETLLASAGNVTSYTDTTAVGNTTYYYKVSAVNGVNLEGPQSNEASATTTQPQGASVVFVKTDTATQGDWQGTYGTQGYNVINDTVSYPAYATVSASGQGAYTWAASSTEVRALARVAGGRIAACWVAGSTMTIDLNLTDGQTHRIALYFLDWDCTDRAESITFLDAGTSAVLDKRSVTSFHGGSYLVWDVTGHVKVQVTLTGGANAVLSGLFFGSTVTAPTPVTQPLPDTSPAILAVPDHGPAPLEVQALAVGVEPNVKRVWNFGDGVTLEAGDLVSHTYFSPGTYTITLTVGGQTARATVVVGEPPPH